MDEDKITNLIKASIAEAFESEREKVWISPEQHYMDHELLKQCRLSRDLHLEDHKFVGELRANMSNTRKIIINTLIGMSCITLAGFVGHAIVFKIITLIRGQ